MSNFEFDIQRYLSRIGAAYPQALTPQTLMELTRAHLEHVPFEVLEMTEGHTEPSLEPEGLYEKIVVNRRGGYCFWLSIPSFRYCSESHSTGISGSIPTP